MFRISRKYWCTLIDFKSKLAWNTNTAEKKKGDLSTDQQETDQHATYTSTGHIKKKFKFPNNLL
jgi:hypothetical protein